MNIKLAQAPMFAKLCVGGYEELLSSCSNQLNGQALWQLLDQIEEPLWTILYPNCQEQLFGQLHEFNNLANFNKTSFVDSSHISNRSSRSRSA